ncbi:Uncharacterized protein DBV15_09376 [Temnothorax longispinosus]|uniref:Uncharacterized protein n=1 Tax=Temnothorax longispinosus TaxID=300112 RepID=A0A4S2KFM0_9HYME|nr:Uncharacterized protein DBV15_09376 [Temnothorax longispinosus]
MQFQMPKKNRRKVRADPGVHGSEEFHSNICIVRVELEICVNRYCQVLANGAFRYGGDSVDAISCTLPGITRRREEYGDWPEAEGVQPRAPNSRYVPFARRGGNLSGDVFPVQRTSQIYKHIEIFCRDSQSANNAGRTGGFVPIRIQDVGNSTILRRYILEDPETWRQAETERRKRIFAMRAELDRYLLIVDLLLKMESRFDKSVSREIDSTTV